MLTDAAATGRRAHASRILGPALLLFLSLPASARTPEAAVAAAMNEMKARLRYDSARPSPRGPHEWDAARVLTAGTFNGCVEAAKALFSLLRAADPTVKARYIDSFNSVGVGGHAVVEVEGADGRVYLVDAASFERLPGPPAAISEEDLARPLDFDPSRHGRVLQFPGRADLYLSKADGRYRMAVYPYSRIFSGRPKRQESFDTLAQLSAAVSDFSRSEAADFRWLEEHGLILPYLDGERSSFLYTTPAGPAKHVVYGCRNVLGKDRAEAEEPSAREAYRGSGRAAPCRP